MYAAVSFVTIRGTSGFEAAEDGSVGWGPRDVVSGLVMLLPRRVKQDALDLWTEVIGCVMLTRQ